MEYTAKIVSTSAGVDQGVVGEDDSLVSKTFRSEDKQKLVSQLSKYFDVDNKEFQNRFYRLDNEDYGDFTNTNGVSYIIRILDSNFNSVNLFED